ncbi:hypothetical protein OHA25_21010 [Nonomuraea sp. NBC_00507]|uniref:hypothetical protein n=1 Tax=unclassified Nonomuraea TaxID=2593643 RepID=UPI00273A9E9F|nr:MULTISPECIES: hypothetical protein [unclassified Nonomuraea]MDP4502994.1 hypothetical protein [Nonomuraea sp. G32]
MLGALVSGLVVGIVGGLAAVLPLTVRLWVLVPVAAVILAFELAGRPLSLPQNRRLVPQEVVNHGSFDGPLQFGFEMGTGVRTFTPTALPHLLVLVTVLVGGIGQGLLVGIGFGLGRALMPTARALSDDPRQWDNAMLRSIVWVGRLCAVGFLLSLLIVVM